MKLKETNASAQLVQYMFKIREGSQKDYGGKNLWKRWVLCLEWKAEKAEGVIDEQRQDCVGSQVGWSW